MKTFEIVSWDLGTALNELTHKLSKERLVDFDTEYSIQLRSVRVKTLPLTEELDGIHFSAQRIFVFDLAKLS